MSVAEGTSSTRAKNKYNAKAYDRIALQVKKGDRERIRSHAADRDESLNGFINRAIDDTMQRDQYGCSSENMKRCLRIDDAEYQAWRQEHMLPLLDKLRDDPEFLEWKRQRDNTAPVEDSQP